MTNEHNRAIHDNVNHPTHYIRDGLETIDVIKAFTSDLVGMEAVCTANALKYICRWKQKNGIEDIKKAIWYLNRLVEEKKEEFEEIKKNLYGNLDDACKRGEIFENEPVLNTPILNYRDLAKSIQQKVAEKQAEFEQINEENLDSDCFGFFINHLDDPIIVSENNIYGYSLFLNWYGFSIAGYALNTEERDAYLNRLYDSMCKDDIRYVFVPRGKDMLVFKESEYIGEAKPVEFPEF